jgi:phosphate transport system substrate-binding protein
VVKASLNGFKTVVRSLNTSLATNLPGKTAWPAAALGCLLAATAAQAANERRGNPEILSISGSSTVYPFSQAAIRAFGKRGDGNVPFRANAVGTTAGMREFCSGAISIAAASRPINASELKRCSARGIRFLELPIAYDAITVVVSRSNTWARQISTDELRRLWNRDAQGRVLRWKQVNPSWPDKPISLCAPGRDSGTYDSFNKAINGSETNARQDVTASEDDNVLVRCVASNPLALGYFGFDYAQANRSSVRALAVAGARGVVTPSEESVQQSRYVPLSRPLFFYVNDQALTANPLIRQFISNTLQNGGRIAREADVIPLHESTYRLVTSKLYRRVLGSAYAGDLPMGLTVGQTLERSFDALKKPEYR